MSLNSSEIDLILSELNLEGYYIQKILQSDFQSLLLTLYRQGEKTDLNISLSPGKTRINRTGRGGKKPEKLQRFSQFLRSRILNARITEATQPGNDRIIKIILTKGGEETKLFIRLWGGNSNIIAADSENRILDAYYRRPGKNEQSGMYFTLPEKKESSSRSFTVREFPSGTDFNTYIDNFYFEEERAETIARLKNSLNAFLTKKLIYLETKLENFCRESDKYTLTENLKQYGDLLLSYSSMYIKGKRWLEVENYYNDNILTRIEVNPDISIEKNAEKYYEKYKKLKKSEENFTEEKINTEKRLKQIQIRLKEVENTESIRILRDWISETENEKKGDKKGPIPGLQFFSEGYTILAGRGAKENDELLRHHVRGNDYWLHARDYPGGYIFIKTKNGKSLPLEVLLNAGNLAVFYSKGKNSGKGEVYYTQVKYLRRTKTGKTGLVIPTQEKNLSITIDEKRLKKLFDADRI